MQCEKAGVAPGPILQLPVQPDDAGPVSQKAASPWGQQRISRQTLSTASRTSSALEPKWL